jgi:hypothetical protein
MVVVRDSHVLIVKLSLCAYVHLLEWDYLPTREGYLLHVGMLGMKDIETTCN